MNSRPNYYFHESSPLYLMGCSSCGLAVREMSREFRGWNHPKNGICPRCGDMLEKVQDESCC